MICKTEQLLRSEVSAKEFVQLIRDAWAKNATVVGSFGGEEAFNSTLDKIEALDQRFQAENGVYFHLGSSPAETAQKFAETQIRYRETGVRPSLPAQVAHYLDEIGLSREDPYYTAAVLVGARAELEHASHPEYHGPNHFSDVVAETIEFLKKNNELSDQRVPGAIKLSPEELAIGITAAAAHDVGHPGGKNTFPGEKLASDPFRLERQSVKIIEPLLKEAGIPRKTIARTRVAILTTSPDMNGPAKLLKEIDRLHHNGQPIEWETLPDHEAFSDLRLLAKDPVTRVISQNLRSADLGQSSMFGLRSNQIATQDLEAEWGDRGYHDKLLGDSTAADGMVIPDGQTIKARKGFLDFAAYGDKGPVAAGARAAVGQNYLDLYADTAMKLAVVKAVEAAHEVSSQS